MDSKGNSLRFFQKSYKRGFFYWWLQRKIFQHLPAYIPITHNEGDLVLSIGFYNSNELFKIKKMLPTCKVVGIDFLESKVAGISRELKSYSSNFSVFSCDLNQIEFEFGYFSGIFAFNSIYFCLDYRSYFQKLRKILNKTGYLLLQIDLQRTSHIYKQHDVPFLKTTEKILESALKSAGFKKIVHFKLPFLKQDDFIIAY